MHMKIICLDDHPAMLDSLVRELNTISPNASISAFQNAETALEFAAENGCDVLFCEIDLYGGDGLLFAEQMQKLNSRLNIIFTTVCEEGERAKEVLRLHPSGYITKPYTQQQLAAELRNLRYPVKETRAAGGPASLSDWYRNAPSARPYSAPKTYSEPKVYDEPKLYSEPKVYVEPKVYAEPKPYAEPQAASASDFSFSAFRSVQAEPTPRYNPEPAPRYNPDPTPRYNPEPAPIPEPAPAPIPEPKEPEAPAEVMSSKELRRLSRAELLEILIAQTKENDKLKAQLRETEEKLSDKTLKIGSAGSIAQAALQINGVFEAAQRAADQYLENVVSQSRTSPFLSREYADRSEHMLSEARAKCAAMEQDTARRCDEMVRSAEAEVQARWSELHQRMESYLREHEQLRSLMRFYQ